MKDIFLFLGAIILLICFWSGCIEAKRDLCSMACAQRGQECAAIDEGFWNKFTCRDPRASPADLRRR
jgi:hypothetical protein